MVEVTDSDSYNGTKWITAVKSFIAQAPDNFFVFLVFIIVLRLFQWPVL